jgi:hypothetical protein
MSVSKPGNGGRSCRQVPTILGVGGVQTLFEIVLALTTQPGKYSKIFSV